MYLSIGTVAMGEALHVSLRQIKKGKSEMAESTVEVGERQEDPGPVHRQSLMLSLI